jgi:sugar phosphate isomerase/epimerase
MGYREYLKLGVNHHLLYAACASEPSEHERTLGKLLADERLEILDMWIQEFDPHRRREIGMIKDSGKEIYYNVGTRKGKEPAHPASLIPEKRRYSLDFYKSELDRAIAVGAKKVITNSGPNNPEKRDAAIDALVAFYTEICNYVPADMLIMIEPTDWDVAKCKLIGSSREAADLSRRMHGGGCRNFSSMVDMGHLPLMHETIAQAMRDTGDQIGHIHMGNCILKDRSHPLFGDKHVALGIEGGEYGEEDLARLLQIGLEMGYFNKESRGSASIEMRPIPGKTPEESLDIYCETLSGAWEIAVSGVKKKGECCSCRKERLS